MSRSRGGGGLTLDDLHRLLSYHQALLADAPRNRVFHRALRRFVTKRSDVLDIGAGTGVWAVAAARLGARRVVAVEKEPLLVPLIEQLARANGVADRVRVVQGDSRRLALEGRFDVIVSETIGNEAFDEGIVDILKDARRRFLRRGGVLIPSRVSLMAAPARLSPGRDRLPAGLDLDWSYFRQLALHIPGSAPRGLELLARPVELAAADLASSRAPRPLGALTGCWSVTDRRRVDGFAVWPEAEVAPGLRLRGLAATAWRPRLYGTEPLPSGPGEVHLRLVLTPGDRRWEVVHRGRKGDVARCYSSLFAFGALRPGARVDRPRRRG